MCNYYICTYVLEYGLILPSYMYMYVYVSELFSAVACSQAVRGWGTTYSRYIHVYSACTCTWVLSTGAEKVTVPPLIAHSDWSLAHRRLEPCPLQIGTSPNTHRPLQITTSPNADRSLSFEHRSLMSMGSATSN